MTRGHKSGSRAHHLRVGIADVRRSQNLAKTSIPLVMRYVFVPIAWPLTAAAARFGLSPNGATVVRGNFSALGLILVSCPSETVFGLGLGLVILAKIADSVDGNLARLQDRASYFGKYLDGLIDMVEDLAFPLALGAHLWLAGAAGPEVLLHGAIAVLSLAVVFIAIYRLPLFELSLKTERGEGALAEGRAAHPRLNAFFASSPGRAVLWCDAHGVNAAYDARFIFLALALVSDALGSYLAFLAALYATGAAFFCAARVARGYAQLDVPRRSRSAT